MSPEIWQSAGVVPVWCEGPCILKGGEGEEVQGSVWGLPKQSDSWFNHTGCLRNQDRDRDQQARDMDKWVVWFYVEPFTLHLNSNVADTIVPHCSGSGPGPCPGTGHNQCDYTITDTTENITFPQLR